MECRISFKHMETSEALSTYAQSKIVQKIQRYATKPIEAHITFSVEHNTHCAHVNVFSGDGFDIQVDASTGDMYSSIDMVVDKLDQKLRRVKEKLKHHKNNHNIRYLNSRQKSSYQDCDSVPVDAADLIKYEKARIRQFG